MSNTPDRTAVAIRDEIGMGEEPYLESTCENCGWPVFLDAEVDDEGELIITAETFWQHNDDRYYAPGEPSPCPTVPWEG